MTDITTLPPADRAMIVLASTKTEEHLRGLVVEATSVTAVIDPDGREQAHRLAMKLRSARTTIEKTGKAARDDANAFAKAVIDEQKRLIAITETEEKRVLALRDGYDARIEAEKEAKRQAEAARVAAIREKIDGIRALPLALAGASSDDIAAEKAALEGFTPTEEVFAEFTDDCKAAIAEALAAMSDLYARVMAQEAAAAMVQAERLKLEEARRQAEAELAAEREALERQRAEARAAAEAIQAEARAEAKKLAAERAAFAAEQAEYRRIQSELMQAEEAKRAALVEQQMRILDQAEDQAIVAAPTGAETEQADEEAAPVASLFEDEPADIGITISDAPVADWTIRQAAIHTAAQFTALAGKVEQCGFGDFAVTLRTVANGLRDGSHDAALAQADRDALIAADTLLLDATAECIEVLSEQQAAA
ncbi:MAG: hypothetical protein ACRCTG_16505 [Aestuariivirga sp.]